MGTVLYPGQVAVPLQSSLSHEEHTNEFVRKRGIPVTWQKAILCPCLTAEGHPRATCRACAGRGYTYVSSATIPVLFTRLTWEPSREESGLWIYGMTFISTPGEIKLGVRDRLQIQSLVTVYSETVPVEKQKLTLNFPPQTVEYLYFFNATGILASVEPAHFSQDGNVLTIIEPTVLDGTLFSVRYLAPLSYLVVSAVHEVRGWSDPRGKVIALPNQYVVQREDAVSQEKEGWVQRG